MNNTKRILLINKRIVFAVVGDRSAAHFWVAPDWKNPDKSYGGMEIHNRPQEDETPDNEHCWLLRGPCKHDGTSLYADETVIPVFHRCCNSFDGNYEEVWSLVEMFLIRNAVQYDHSP